MSTDGNLLYSKPELWGGIECTINRVGNVFRDQLLYANHYTRLEDIRRIAELGIRKLRYPVLWEYHQPDPEKKINWSWTEKQLQAIRDHGIEPIAGLLHHGSGPVFTNLLDDRFPQRFAAYARKVAQQFPWLTHYTPVNEPLTTARFSGLYGLWYPHRQDELSFIKMLLNEIRATVEGMKMIRQVNPDAVLIQTEDLSKTHSTPPLKYQADFENLRRWLTYDLLCGKLNNHHFFWDYLLRLGIPEAELQYFLENPCPPSVMGFNYYVTSERFLDHDVDKYPPALHGGNGRHRYVDTEAVRRTELDGLGKLIREAWNRYALPLAVTECHLHCTREEQLRWFSETWDTCCMLKRDGVDVRAVTAWSLLGAFDWNSLLTEENFHYEPGSFDISNQNFRPTALARLVRSVALGKEYEHPLLGEKGWWRQSAKNPKPKSMNTAPLLIIGRNGTLGQAFMRICEQRSIPYVAVSRMELDISREDQIARSIEQYRPWAIVNAAGYVRVDDAETERNECFAINTTGPGLVARLCREHGIRFMTFSTDLVFDGSKKAPYHEADDVKPLNVYGESKAEAEKLVIELNRESLIIRTSAFFGPWDQYNFAYYVLQSLQNGQPCPVVNDVIVSPTYVPDLAHTAMDIFIDEEAGIWHLSNEGMLTWSEFAGLIAEGAGLDTRRLVTKSHYEMGWKARRPLYSALQTGKAIRMPRLENAIHRYFEHRIPA